MKVALNFRRAGYAACIASGMLAVFVAGCSTNSEVIVSDVEMGEEANLGEMTVADLLANGKYAEAEALARACLSGGRHPFPYANEVVTGRNGADLEKRFHEFAPASNADVTMHRLNLCSVLLLEGKKDEAHRELQNAREELELMFDPDSQALKLLHGEREKYFKGDGYERSTLYAFLALSFMERGDFNKALKCVQCGILADSDTEKMEYRADYALLPYIGYVAAKKAGANWRQEARKYDALVKELTGAAPSERELPTAILVVWVGRGTDRTLGGEFDEKRFVRKGSSKGNLDGISICANGTEMTSMPDLADLNFQATTRGGRLMDHILDSKATAKRGLIASGNALLAFGAGCVQAGFASGRGEVAVVMLAVGGVCVGLGYPTHLMGMAVNSQADDRCWQTLPGRLVVVPLNIPPGRREMDILGYRRLDNVMRKPIVLDFSGATGDGIPVCHFSLVADRDAVEDVVGKGITVPMEEIAARTKEDAYADKIELTRENDR